MANKGHKVEVFCGSFNENSSTTKNNVIVHRILCIDRQYFYKSVLDKFKLQHAIQAFDIVESGEYLADGFDIRKDYPTVPFVVKLHTPIFLVMQLQLTYDNWIKRTRFILGGLLSLKLNRPYWIFDSKNDKEKWLTQSATLVSSPSISLGNIVSKKWNIERNKIETISYPYVPSEELLTIPIETATNTVTYIGRIEIRKGVIALAFAIKLISKLRPFAKFRFIGKTVSSPRNGVDMKQYLQDILRGTDIEFMDNISLECIPKALSKQISIFFQVFGRIFQTCVWRL